MVLGRLQETDERKAGIEEEGGALMGASSGSSAFTSVDDVAGGGATWPIAWC
jgi:hypothetical protein